MASFESFPLQSFETADVSLIEGTIAGSNHSFFFASPRSRTQEAEGSIPFSSTRFFDFNFLERPFETIRGPIVSNSRALRRRVGPLQHGHHATLLRA